MWTLWILVTKWCCNAQTGRRHIANPLPYVRRMLGNHFAINRRPVTVEAMIHHRLIADQSQTGRTSLQTGPTIFYKKLITVQSETNLRWNKTTSQPLRDQWNLWATKSIAANLLCMLKRLAYDRFGSATDRRLVATSIKPFWDLWDFFMIVNFGGRKVSYRSRIFLSDQWVKILSIKFGTAELLNIITKAGSYLTIVSTLFPRFSFFSNHSGTCSAACTFHT